MTVDGRDLVRRYLEDVFNRGNLDANEQYLAGEKFIAGVVALATAWRTAFSDFHEEIKDVFADGDQVIVVSELSGTHDGVLDSSLGMIEPTGRHARWPRIAVRRLDGDRFVDGFFVEDELGLLQQLGVFGAEASEPDRGRHSPLAQIQGRR
jgi:predicted ester cyclase